MSVTFPKSQFDRLPKSQQEILANIGITPKTVLPSIRKTLPRQKVFPLKPYILEVEFHCNFCEAIFTEKYEMRDQFTEDIPYLEGKLVTTKNKPDRKTTRPVAVCKYCKGMLREWSKGGLIDEVINLRGLLDTALKGGK